MDSVELTEHRTMPRAAISAIQIHDVYTGIIVTIASIDYSMNGNGMLFYECALC